MAGYDGGLPQKFILEVYHGDVDFLSNSQPLYNVSNADEPSFSLAGLEASVEAGVHVAVYAVNAKGRSQPVILSEVTYRDAEKRTGKKKKNSRFSSSLFFPFSASLVCCLRTQVSRYFYLPLYILTHLSCPNDIDKMTRILKNSSDRNG